MGRIARIDVPTDYTVAIAPTGTMHAVLIAPPGVTADVAMLTRPGRSASVLTHDAGLTWPDAEGCGIAEACIAFGYPVGLIFQDEASATACRDRLLREARQ